MNPNQYTKEWWLARRGKITGSRVHRIVNGTPAGWQTLGKELANEELMPEMPAEMLERAGGAREHGHEYEEVAIADASIRLGFEYEQPGLKVHPTIPYLAVSSDFIISDWKGRRYNGEAKCPFNPERHRNIWMTKTLPNIYKCQVQLEMECWELDHTLFITYCPMFIDHKSRGREIVVVRDQNFIDHMKSRCEEFYETIMENSRKSCRPTPLSPPPQLF